MATSELEVVLVSSSDSSTSSNTIIVDDTGDKDGTALGMTTTGVVVVGIGGEGLCCRAAHKDSTLLSAGCFEMTAAEERKKAASASLASSS